MQEIDGVDGYRNGYLSGIRAFLEKHGGEVLVASFGAQPAEGDPPNSTVVIRFATTEAAWGFLDDPDYQPLREIRMNTTSRNQMVIAPEFVPPS